MTIAEYEAVEANFDSNIYRFGNTDNVVAIMSRDVFNAAMCYGNGSHIGYLGAGDVRAKYQGYDVYVIEQNVENILAPAIKWNINTRDIGFVQENDYMIAKDDEAGVWDIYSCDVAGERNFTFRKTDLTVRAPMLSVEGLQCDSSYYIPSSYEISYVFEPDSLRFCSTSDTSFLSWLDRQVSGAIGYHQTENDDCDDGKDEEKELDEFLNSFKIIDQ